MTILIVIVLLLAWLFVMALMCRTDHKDLPRLQGWAYAHRGLHGNGVPENSMSAFRLALQKGYGIELDIHLLKDGGLAVIHDAALKRTTGCDGSVEDLTTAELTNYHLEGTEDTIPRFQEVLELFAGKAPLIIELKAERGNHAALAEAACKALEGYSGVYCIESFDPRCIQWLRKNRPEIIRGQLSENFLTAKSTNLSGLLRFALTNLLTNFLTRPDFIAYKFEDRNGLAPWLCRHWWHAQPVSWTIRSQKDFDTAVKEGSLPIFEHFEP